MREGAFVMKSFVQSIVSSDERVLIIARLHWIHLVVGILWFLSLSFIGVAAEILLSERFGVWPGPAADFYFFEIAANFGTLRWMFVIGGLTVLAGILLEYFSTEVGLTDRRFIYKTGFVMVEVEEIEVEDIRGEHVHHGLIGALIGYGGLKIECRYVDSVSVPAVGGPHRFVRALHALRATRRLGDPARYPALPAPEAHTHKAA